MNDENMKKEEKKRKSGFLWKYTYVFFPALPKSSMYVAACVPSSRDMETSHLKGGEEGF